jgi:nicotinic acid mononucleotide adenylyltransferase
MPESKFHALWFSKLKVLPTTMPPKKKKRNAKAKLERSAMAERAIQEAQEKVLCYIHVRVIQKHDKI